MAFENYNVENNARTVLANGILAGDTTITLKTGEGALFPATQFIATLEHWDANGVVTKREVVKVTSRAGDVLTGVTRAFEPCVQEDSQTTKTATQNPLNFDANDFLEIRVTKKLLKDITDEIVRLETDKANDNVVVKLAGTQTITGDKSFTGDVNFVDHPTQVSYVAPTLDNEYVPKKYVDDEITEASAVGVLSNSDFLAGEYLLGGDSLFVEEQAEDTSNITDSFTGVTPNPKIRKEVVGGKFYQNDAAYIWLDAAGITIFQNYFKSLSVGGLDNIDLKTSILVDISGINQTNAYMGLWKDNNNYATIRAYHSSIGGGSNQIYLKVVSGGVPVYESLYNLAGQWAQAKPINILYDGTTVSAYFGETTGGEANILIGSYAISEIYTNIMLSGDVVSFNSGFHRWKFDNFSLNGVIVPSKTQNIGDTTDNTRFSTRQVSSGVISDTMKLNLFSEGVPSVDLGFRVESDNAGEPSGTLIDANAYGNISYTDMGLGYARLHFQGNVTILKGTIVHLVLFQGTYGSEEINVANYYKIGYSQKHTTTRGALIYDGTIYKANSGPLVTDAHGTTVDYHGAGYTALYGWKLGAKGRLIVSSVTKTSVATPTICKLFDSGYNLLESASFSGDVATFTQTHIVEGDFFLECYAGGESYTITRYNTSSNIQKGNLIFINGTISGVSQAKGYIISDITTRIVDWMPYASSDLFESLLLSKTDATYTYKLPDIPRIAKNDYSAGALALYDFAGISKHITGLTKGTKYYVSSTAGAISLSVGGNHCQIGETINSNEIILDTFEEIVYAGANYTAFTANATKVDSNLGNTYSKQKEARVFKYGIYKINFSTRYTISVNDSNAVIYVNGVLTGTPRVGSGVNSRTYFSENIALSRGDLVQIYTKKSTSGTTEVSNFSATYDRLSKEKRTFGEVLID